MLATSIAAALAVLAPLPQTTAGLNAEGPTPYSQVAGASYQPRVLNDADTAAFRQGLAAARAKDIAGARGAINQIGDPAARKLVEWALVDTSADRMSWRELSDDARTLRDWPRADARVSATEIALDRAGVSANEVLGYFGSDQPATVQGAIALAWALEQTGRQGEAQRLVRDWWRTQSFAEADQSRFLARWSGWLSQDDHDARLGVLLSGPHGPATRAMVNLASADRRATAQAAMTLRSAYSPDAVVADLTPNQALDPAVVQERVRILRAANRNNEAYPLLRYLPAAPSHRDGQDTLWSERRNLFIDALQDRNWQAAYDAMNGHGFPSGDRLVDAEFFAGWVALTKLGDPGRAAQHFERLRTVSSTPITQGRAAYWLGRAAEARGDQAGAQQWYRSGAQYIQTFYGQLAAEKAGYGSITLPGDPSPTSADVAQFENRELVRAMRILGETGEMGLFRVFAYHLDDSVPLPTDLALLMDLSRGYGEGFTAMMVGRAASQRGVLMPERMYPVRIPPSVPGAAPLEFTLAITRQESSFDPRARSHADARGMMQFLPSTASGVARRLGMPYSAERLWDPDYNMTLGSYHLGELMNQFGGSMLLTTVGYNAGPGRPSQWIARCGDPRGGQVDPVDFIECAPFTETRNYMMRVMENMAVYKARLNGGTAPLTTSSDIARGVAGMGASSVGSGPRPYIP
ncbi:transglycosylase SLT domain-containing protein [Brevundimonas sp. VNH65]|uniref:lytic transglycosylase domain-containing protein n=1 Tax=Brevundimonas sp. VNH65 TaxID=3400917 RepID=UPI003BFC5F68